MLSFPADENFNRPVVHGLRRRLPTLELVRVQDVGPTGADDPAVLAWAAGERRILLTHDVKTLIGFAYDRVAAGLVIPGVLEVTLRFTVRQIIEEIALTAECVGSEESDGLVRFLPL